MRQGSEPPTTLLTRATFAARPQPSLDALRLRDHLLVIVAVCAIAALLVWLG